MIYFNNASAWTRVYLGNTEYSKVYSSEAQVWPSTTPPTPTNFKISAIKNDSSTFTVDCDGQPIDFYDIGSNYTLRQSIVSAEVGDCVTSSSGQTFSQCTGMTSVTLPTTLTNLGWQDFNMCISLTGVTIPGSVTTIDSGAFQHCSSMTVVNMSSAVTQIGGSAFYHCYNITEITLPEGLLSIGMDAFQGAGLTSVTIPSTVTSIGQTAFSNGNTPITYVVCLPTTPPTLGQSVFDANDGYKYPIYVPCEALGAYQSAPNWSSYASRIQPISGSCGDVFKVKFDFVGSPSVTADCASVLIDSNIGDIIPEGLTKEDVTSITIGNCAVRISGDSFAGYSNVVSVSFPSDLDSGLGVIRGDVFSGCTSLTSVTIPNTVTEMIGSTFKNCTSLRTAVLPNTLRFFMGATFYNCSSLSSVTLPTNVTKLNNFMFGGCSSLTSVTIPSAVTTIEYEVFRNCSSLTSVTIPSGVTSIEYNAFRDCTSLTSVTCLATTPPTLGTNVFQNANNCTILVPAASVNAYKTATNWSEYASRIQAIPNS